MPLLYCDVNMAEQAEIMRLERSPRSPGADAGGRWPAVDGNSALAGASAIDTMPVMPAVCACDAGRRAERKPAIGVAACATCEGSGVGRAFIAR